MSQQINGEAAVDPLNDHGPFYATSMEPRTHDSSHMSSHSIVAPRLMPGGYPESPPTNKHHRTTSRSPSKRDVRSFSNPVYSRSPQLANSRSSPNFSPNSRIPQRSFKDLVNQFNQEPTIPTPGDGHKRAREQRPTKLTKPRSPTKLPHQRGNGKIQPRKEPPSDRLPVNTRDISSGDISSKSGDSLSSSASTPNTGNRRLRKPLFGEMIQNGNNMPNLGHGIPTHDALRRGSDGSVYHAPTRTPHSRSRSSADGSPNYPYPHQIENESYKKHGRSQSDLSAPHDRQDSYGAFHERAAYQLPTFDNPYQHDDRPVQPPYSNEAFSNNHYPPISPSRMRPAAKNHFPSPRSPKSPSGDRPRVPMRPLPDGHRNHTSPQMSRAHDLYVRSHAPSDYHMQAPAYSQAPQSPPLRSSRPRQPVSMATTAASRARAADRFTGRAAPPSEEQFQKYRQRKRIPELGRIDLAERRARIERAISQNLEDRSDAESRTSRSSSRRGDRKASLADVAEMLPSPPLEVAENATEHSLGAHPQPALFIDTANAPQNASTEPTTAGTEFEEDRTPFSNQALDVPSIVDTGRDETERKPTDSAMLENAEFSEVRLPRQGEEQQSLLDSVMRMREHSSSSDERSASMDERSIFLPNDDRGSIRIMLDGQDFSQHNDPYGPHSVPVSQIILPEAIDAPSDAQPEVNDDHVLLRNQVYGANNDDESAPQTPRRPIMTDDELEVTPRPSDKRAIASLISSTSAQIPDSTDGHSAMQNIIQEYQNGSTTPKMTPAALSEAISHSININTSAGAPPDTSNTVSQDRETLEFLSPATYQAPAAAFQSDERDDTSTETPDNVTPIAATMDHVSHATSHHTQDTAQPRSVVGHEQVDVSAGAEETGKAPTPPPKDSGYSPRSSRSFNRISARYDARPPSPPSARMSKISDFQYLPEMEFEGSLGQGLGLGLGTHLVLDRDGNAPPAPVYAPPPPPGASPASTSIPTSASSDKTIAADAVRSMPQAPVVPRRSGSLAFRPSAEAQRIEVLVLPDSQSMSSMSHASTRVPSTERSSPTTGEEVSPEQKRLVKRRNIIKELVDTEYSYHQDMKIIEDIYKATVGDLISVDDKKTLFGNSDQIEAFSLEFYDALRRAVAPFYVPAKSTRWHTKRASFSTSNSGNTDQSGVDPEEEINKKTVVGGTFVQHLPRMEKVYSAYLKNHEFANQRLSKLQGDPTVKCWLTECHSNASDITSAWDLDSLLVKPVQRILKYPLLLQQLLETTSADHPDHASLEAAVKESLNISHRINEAKKRADLVDSIVNRKRKESDVRTGLAKAFGRRTDKLKERVGIAEAYQDAEFDELAHKFGGHFIRLQVCMRDVQGSLAETDRAVERFNGFAAALESYIEVGQSQYPELESKWRKYALAIRELSVVALADYKAQVKRRVIDPMVMAINLHEGPQNAITKRKKRIVDHAKCKAMEKRGEKPDKRTIEASELYEALNEQLKIDLPKLYGLTADLIQNCLACHVEIQKDWNWTWKMKLQPVLDEFPTNIESIQPDFNADYELVQAQVLSLGLCNGSLLADTANFLSPQTTLGGDERYYRGAGHRTLSVGSDYSPNYLTPNGALNHSPSDPQVSMLPNGQPANRMRSSSSLSGRARSSSSQGGLPQARLPPNNTPKASFSSSRPPTSSRPSDLAWAPSYSRPSIDNGRNTRPGSGTSHMDPNQHRWSGMFSSALPPSEASSQPGSAQGSNFRTSASGYAIYQPQQYAPQSPGPPMSPSQTPSAPDDAPVMFVAASLFEFNIDRARREAGYPYLTYVQGEVFDVIAQKGELWLAKNQDDGTNSLGWIWEQHFVILSQGAE